MSGAFTREQALDFAQRQRFHGWRLPLIPIHELLARIRWDPGFGKARFELAYLDRTREALVRLPLERIRTSPNDHFGFEALEADGTVHSVPYHRVRAVWRDGELIWSRK